MSLKHHIHHANNKIDQVSSTLTDRIDQLNNSLTRKMDQIDAGLNGRMTTFENKLNHVIKDVAVLKWMTSTIVVGVASLILKTFF